MKEIVVFVPSPESLETALQRMMEDFGTEFLSHILNSVTQSQINDLRPEGYLRTIALGIGIGIVAERLRVSGPTTYTEIPT